MSQNWNPNNTTYQEWVVPPYHAYTPAEGVNDGQRLWDNMIKNNPNVRLVICGHAGVAYLRSIKDDGSVCDQLMRDYTPLPNGGAWLTMYRLDHANNQIAINTYGPVANMNLIAPLTTAYLEDLVKCGWR